MTLKEALSYQPVALGFGTSGLRGLVKDMTDLECYINVAGFLRYLEEHDNLQKGENIYIGGDLRESTPRIMQVVVDACLQVELTPINCGLLPTPALAFYAMQKQGPCIMVTGSHIPADRNGIKFYKRDGEVLKNDEAAIQAAVAGVREEIYGEETQGSRFTSTGVLNGVASLPDEQPDATQLYIKRFLDFFPATLLTGKKIVVYQQSAVGRDLMVQVANSLGGEAIPIERSESFIPIDTENVTPEEEVRFKRFANQHPDAFAIISTDGDSDRPFVIDENGTFYRGDILGAVVADFLQARFAALPISGNDAVDDYARQKGFELVHTKIGSPYVIAAMNKADPSQGPIVSWEVNGGFLIGSPVSLSGKTLSPLPTRDALLPILCALAAALQHNQKVSELFAALPQRFTGGGLIDNVDEAKIQTFREVCVDQSKAEGLMKTIFGATDLGAVKTVNLIDGLRLIFESDEVIHLRPSGNAPQFRVYTNADSQTRADELVEAAIKPNGYIEVLLKQL